MTAKPHAAPEDKLTRMGQGRGTRGRKGPRGDGALRGGARDRGPRRGLTPPIYEQVLALEKADKEAAGTE